MFLFSLFDSGIITSLTLDSRNTGCLYNKLIFHAMTESSSPYYVVTDNDIYPPKLSPDWLSRMVKIMDEHPKISMLTPHIPPVQLMGPCGINDDEDVVFCKALGNAFKMVRRSLFPLDKIEQKLGIYGDDGLVSMHIRNGGYQMAFCKHIFCMHAGQTENWGYTQEELEKDPRKSVQVTGYKQAYIKPFMLDVDQETYEPVDKNNYWI